jgi:hypothetical protein
MLAAPLSNLLDSEPDWSSTAMPSDRKCVTCGDFTATKRGKYCTAHSPSTALVKKKASLASLEALPEASQPQATIVSLSNEVRFLEQLAEEEEKSPEAPAVELFCPRSGTWSGSEKAPSEAAEPAAGPSSPQGLPQGLPAQEVPEEPLDSTEEPSSPQGLPQGLPAQNAAEEEPSDSDVASKRYANKLRRELREGQTARGQPLTEEQAQSHLAKLRRRMLILPARYQQAELARVNELERRFLGHLTTVVNTVNAHTTAALEPLIARAEGRLPPMREGQTLAQRKTELDLAMVSLRSERREIVLAEKRGRDERRAAQQSKRRRKAEEDTS